MRETFDFSGLIDSAEQETVDVRMPFDQSRIDIVSQQISVFNVVARIRNAEINLTPEYQRNTDLWHDSEQSRLIESLILGIPLQSFYFDVRIVQGEQGLQRQVWDVVDGLQRLSSLRSYLIDGKRFKGLEYLSEYDGKRYDELPRILQRNILEAQLYVNLIRSGTPEEVKFNIFKRVNTGGLPLTQQEIRHALFGGRGMRFVADLAASKEFRAATSKRVGQKRLLNQEYVNRFLAFYLLDVDDSYRTLDTFMNDALRIVNSKPDADLDEIRRVFFHSLSVIHAVLGDRAFVRYDVKRQSWSKKINKAIFEVLTVQVARLTDAEREILRTCPTFVDDYRRLFESESDVPFTATISSSTDAKARIQSRHAVMREFLRNELEVSL